jgi:hypothetical protein
MNKQWSSGFARRVADTLLFAVPPTTPGPGDGQTRVPFTERARQATEEIAATFAALSSKEVQEVLDFVEFIRDRKLLHVSALSETWAFEKLQEVQDFASFLRDNSGSRNPTDEKDSWSEDDQRDVTTAALSIWDQREAEGQP